MPNSSESPDEPEDALLALDLEGSRELLGEFHAEAADHLQQIEAAMLAVECRPEDREAIDAAFRSFHTIKGNAGFLGLEPMRSLAHEVETILDLARNRRLRIDSKVVTAVLRSRDALKALNDQIGAALGSGRPPEKMIPVATLVAAARRLATEGSTEAASPAEPAPVEPAAGSEAEAGQPQAGVASAANTVRVSTEKLDALMDVVGELVIVQSQLSETARRHGSAAPTLAGNVGRLARLTKDLQLTSMRLRMIPIQPIFQKMERLARDLAGDCGKKVDFSTAGGETELDRTMVEEIADPLVHMVRNAVDHGLETTEERLAAGKPEVGSVSLRAGHQGGQIVIELEDDGRGLNPAKILAKARERGLAPAEGAPPPEQIYGYIFLPGFSTADRITSISGRGVGMDVVKRNIEKMRGKVEISSEPGRGTKFAIRLPLTLAIIDGLVVRVGEERFILPAASVQRALRPARENIAAIRGFGETLDLRGRILPLRRLDRRLGITGTAREPWEGIAIIVEVSGKACALLVDEMLSKQEVVIKTLGAALMDLPGVAGGAILGDGGVALVLDPGTLLEAA